MKINWNDSFMRTADLNMDKEYLRVEEDSWNGRLKLDGYVFLNDVLDALGVDKIKRGQLDGWIYDELEPDSKQKIKFKLKEENGELIINLNEEKDIIDHIFTK